MLRGIDGRTALVSGAGQGIGRSIAERLSQEGAHVWVNDINVESARETATDIGGIAIPFDASDATAVRAAVDHCVGKSGGIDLLVANHAHMSMGPFEDQLGAELQRSLEVNLLGTAWLMQACAPAMAKRRYGRMVAISSEWGLTGWPRASAYAASKGGIVALVKSMARRFASAGVAINAVAPGIVDTPQLGVDASDAGVDLRTMADRYADEIPLGRIGRPPDVAAVTAFLLSAPAIAFVGHVIVANGGATRF